MNTPDKSTPEYIAKQVDAQMEELWTEFEAHEKECQAKNPNMTDRDLIMRIWMLQKIAGLQCVVLNLVERVAELEKMTVKKR